MTSSRLELTARGRGALVGVLLVLLLAFYSTNVLLFAVAAFLSVLVLAALLSFARATRGFGPEAFEVERSECSSFARVGGSALLSVRVTSRLARNFYVELFDEYPDRISVLEGRPRLATWWRGGETLTLAYVVAPRTRGLFEIGPTVVVAHEPLGLAFKSVALESPWSLETIPHPSAVPLGHPGRLWNLIVGQAALSSRGAGTEFHALREYQPGDEPRHIAWLRSAQSTIYSREYDRENQQDLLVAIDLGPSMSMGPSGDDALEKAIHAASYVLSAGFDEDARCGLLLFSDRVETLLLPGRGPDHEFRVFRALAGATVGPRPSSLGGALDRLLPHLGRPTNLVVFSTLEGDPVRILASSGAMRRAGHRLYVLVPDVQAMYPPLLNPVAQAALTFAVGPEAHRAGATGRALGGSGVPVAFFGLEGAVGFVSALYRRRAVRAGVG